MPGPAPRILPLVKTLDRLRSAAQVEVAGEDLDLTGRGEREQEVGGPPHLRLGEAAVRSYGSRAGSRWSACRPPGRATRTAWSTLRSFAQARRAAAPRRSAAARHRGESLEG